MLALVAVAAFSGCAGDPEGTVSITTGEETDAFSRAPAPTSLVAEAVALDRSRRELARAALPTDSFSLGDLPRSDVGAIAVTALDAAGRPVLRGETLYVQWGALESAGLEVFVQRTGELARVPRGPAAIDAVHATVAVGRYLLATNGSATILYDLLNLRALDAPPSFPRPARSLVTFDTTALLVDEQGATAFDLQTRREGNVEAPAGATFGEIAGGATIRASEGRQLVVGATRLEGGPSARLLELAADGKLTAATLANAREGACATWVEGRGLVVYGGSESAPGGEVLAPGATQSAALPFPSDPIRGCGAAALDGSHVLVVGEQARVLDLACAANCEPALWPGALGLVRAEAFTLAPDAALVLGDDVTGASRVFRASASGVTEIPLKTPRRGARLVPLPQDGIVMIAGGGPGLEQYAE
jgi:hypothetical protein